MTRKDKYTNSDGYVQVYCPYHPRANKNGYLPEHILAIYDAINGYPRSAHVHHINGIKHDNRLINLVLCLNNDQHMMLHRKVRE